jgi:hypothetical protein
MRNEEGERKNMREIHMHSAIYTCKIEQEKGGKKRKEKRAGGKRVKSHYSPHAINIRIISKKFKHIWTPFSIKSVLNIILHLIGVKF